MATLIIMAKKQKEPANKNYPLDGMCFVFTGDISMGREDAKSKVIMLGGRVTTLPTGKTTHVVVGKDPGPSKMKRIKELSINMLDDEGFTKLINENSENFHDTIVVDLENSNTEKKMPAGTGKEVWCEKWRPQKPADFVGNQSIYSQLKGFLQGKTSFKAALLSGPPGIGKTTMAYVVAKELRMKIVEFNASDVRNKGELASRVRDGLNFYSISSNMKMQNKVLIMDEIDGMTSDRGGIAELARIIKGSRIPIVCICNDRYHQKIRTLSYQCMDLRFRRLESRQIIPRIKLILNEEGKGMSDSILNEIVQISSGDMRYVLNTIQNLVARKKISHEQIMGFVRKSSMKNIFELSTEMFHKKSISEKIDIYFEDYSFVPLMIQENYLKLNFRNVADIYSSADSISIADIFECHIRGPNQVWGLAPAHAFFGSIHPTRNSFLNKKIDFPAYLGQNSKKLKNKRGLSDISTHTFKVIKADKADLRLYYIDFIFKQYIYNLGNKDIGKSLSILEEYFLLKEDIDSMTDLVIDGAVLLKGIEAKTKSALTKAYKKMQRVLPYAVPEKNKGERGSNEEEEPIP